MAVKRYTFIILLLIFSLFLILSVNCRQGQSSPQEEVLARVGGEKITRADLESEIKMYPKTEQYKFQNPEGEKYLLRQIINRRVLEIAARSTGLDKEPQVLKKINVAVQNVLAGEFYYRYVKQRLWIPDETLKDYYNKHKDDYKLPERRIIKHILRSDKASIDGIYERLKKGEKFEDLASQLSQDKFTKDTGGLIGSITKDEYEGSEIAMDPKVHEVAFSINEGEYSQPFQNRLGYSILKVDKIIPPAPSPYEDVVDKVAKDVAVPEEKAREYYDKNIEKFKQDEMIEIRHGYFGTQKEASDAILAIKSGKQFDDVLSSSTMPESVKSSGGYRNWIKRGNIIPTVGVDEALENALFALKVGDLYGPYKSDKGWHIFQIEDRKEAGIKPYEEVKDTIEYQLLTEYSDKSEEKAFLDMQDKYKVINYLELGSYRMMTPEQILEEARNSRTPLTAFDAYRAFTIIYPDHPDTNKALFLMGFIQSEQLHEYSKAQALFEEYLEKYPKGEFADSAHWMLENLKTGEPLPEDLKSKVEESGGKIDETGRTGTEEIKSH